MLFFFIFSGKISKKNLGAQRLSRTFKKKQKNIKKTVDFKAAVKIIIMS